MSENRFWLGRARKREREDIRKFIPVLGKVLAPTQRPHGIEVERKARERKRRTREKQLDLKRKEATCVPAIALSKGVRKKSSAKDNQRECEESENTPPKQLNKTIPSPPPPPSHTVYNCLNDEQGISVSEHTNCSSFPSSAVTDRSSASAAETPPTPLTLEEDAPSSWDSIIDGSLPSQLPDRYKVSENSLLAVMSCDTDQLLAQLQ